MRVLFFQEETQVRAVFMKKEGVDHPYRALPLLGTLDGVLYAEFTLEGLEIFSESGVDLVAAMQVVAAEMFAIGYYGETRNVALGAPSDEGLFFRILAQGDGSLSTETLTERSARLEEDLRKDETIRLAFGMSEIIEGISPAQTARLGRIARYLEEDRFDCNFMEGLRFITSSSFRLGDELRRKQRPA